MTEEQQVAEPISERTIAELLPLDAQQRTVSYVSGGTTYRHLFRKLRPEDWDAYFSRVRAEFRQTADGYEQVLDADSAALELYRRAAVSVEGFKVAEGERMEKWPSWPDCVPINHRILAVQLLMQVSVSESDKEITADGRVVVLDAVWSEDPSAAGRMKEYRGLVHRFAFPSAEHSRKYLLAKNRSSIIGGSRAGTTRLASAHPTLVKLYDELIQGVEGYSIAGRPLESKEEIIRDMDAAHKTVALQELFPATVPMDPRVAQREQSEEIS